MSKRKDGSYTGSQIIAIRMPNSEMKLLNEGVELSGLNRPDFIKEAVRKEVERLRNIK